MTPGPSVRSRPARSLRPLHTSLPATTTGTCSRRHLHSRVDWTLGVAVTTAGSDGARGWRDILVVGDPPDRASGPAYG